MRKTKLLTSLLGLAGLSSLITPALASCSVNSEDIVYEECNVSLAKNIQENYKLNISKIRKGHDLYATISSKNGALGWNGNKVNVKVDGTSLSSKNFTFKIDPTSVSVQDSHFLIYKLHVPAEYITGDVVISIPTGGIVPFDGVIQSPEQQYTSNITFGSGKPITAENFYGDHEITCTVNELSGENFAIVATDDIWYGGDYIPYNETHESIRGSYWYSDEIGSSATIHLHIANDLEYSPESPLSIVYLITSFQDPEDYCEPVINGYIETDIDDERYHLNKSDYTIYSKGLDNHTWCGQDIYISLSKNIAPSLIFHKGSAIIQIDGYEMALVSEYNVELMDNNRTLKISFTQNTKAGMVGFHSYEGWWPDIWIDFMVARNYDEVVLTSQTYIDTSIAPGKLYDADHKKLNFSILDLLYSYQMETNYVFTFELNDPITYQLDGEVDPSENQCCIYFHFVNPDDPENDNRDDQLNPSFINTTFLPNSAGLRMEISWWDCLDCYNQLKSIMEYDLTHEFTKIWFIVTYSPIPRD